MLSHTGRYVIIFNGEIYNFSDLRQELEGAGVQFRGRSDTEVVLAAFEHWGFDAAIPKFDGMFAFAAWDRQDCQLLLARDRMGEKPLYCAWSGGIFLFASELKALHRHPDFEPKLDRGALALYLRHGYIPGPHTIYAGVTKLPAAGTLRVSRRNREAIPLPYWSVSDAANNGVSNPFSVGEEAAAEELNRLLRESVRRRMVADVPLGAFLSGGIDSSLVVALMQAQAARPVKTFTIGFDHPDYDEAGLARAVAQELGTEHTELRVTAADALALIPHLPAIYDEPFADPSQIPTLLVSELARRHVTVSLSGDGGDELFAGYQRYFAGQALWAKVRRLTKPGRHALSKAIRAVPAKNLDSLSGLFASTASRYSRPGKIGDKLHKTAGIIRARCPEELYYNLVSQCHATGDFIIDAAEPETPFTNASLDPRLPDFMHHMMYMDQVTYLPDDILVKLDRASMAVSLESRVPMLDHKIVEFAWRVPLTFQIKNGQGKALLRRVLSRYLRPSIWDRPKRGFGIPIGEWLRGHLRGWAEELLSESRLRSQGLLHHEPIQQRWREHLAGRRNWNHFLWTVLCFQAWLARDNSALGSFAGRAQPAVTA
jgi:asparagine synthase (glutamine-hydrolysing)